MAFFRFPLERCFSPSASAFLTDGLGGLGLLELERFDRDDPPQPAIPIRTASPNSTNARGASLDPQSTFILKPLSHPRSDLQVM